MAVDRALVRETKALIREVERGDTAHAAWVAVRDRVERLYEGRTQTEVGKLLGKSGKWVSDLLRWDSSSSSVESPFARDAAPGRKASVQNAEARKILEEAPIEEVEKIAMKLPPERRRKVIDAIASTHPARQPKPIDGMGERAREREEAQPFHVRMNAAMLGLHDAISKVLADHEAYVDDAEPGEVEVLHDQINDEAARLTARTADPEELLR